MKNIIITTQPHWLNLLKQVPHNLIAIQPQFVKMLQDVDINARALGEYLTDEARANAISDASNAHFDLMQQTTDTEFPDAPKINTWLQGNGLARYFYPRLIELSLVLQAFALAEPDLLIVHNDVEPMNRLLALSARKLNVSVLHIPHAIYFDTEDRGAPGTDVHDIVTADYLAASGPFQAQWYQTRAPDQKIYVTGLPQFDRLANVKRDRDTACRLLHLNAYKPVITYMSSWAQHTNLLGCHSGVEDAYLNMLAAIKILPDAQLIVKCHPRGANTQWHVDAARKANVACVVTHQHLDTVLQASDVIVSYGASNVVLEAAALSGTRLIAIDGFASDSEVVTITSERDDILQAVASALIQPAPDMHSLLYKYLGQMDGNATTRIAQLIEKILNGN